MIEHFFKGVYTGIVLNELSKPKIDRYKTICCCCKCRVMQKTLINYGEVYICKDCLKQLEIKENPNEKK